MTQKAAICKSLLDGHVLSIMNGFKWFGCTNIPREIGRSIEREFDVQVSRVRKEFTSRYKQPGSYFEYRLNHTEYNKEGIAKMEAYVSETIQAEFKSIVKRGAKTIHVKENEPPAEQKIKYQQANLFNFDGSQNKHTQEEINSWDITHDD